MHWKRVLLIALVASGLAFASSPSSDAQISVGIGPVGIGVGGYYGYPGYYRPYPYYGYYAGPSYYWYGGHRYYRHHRHHYYYGY
jgi:hypothetical protein